MLWPIYLTPYKTNSRAHGPSQGVGHWSVAGVLRVEVLRVEVKPV